MPLAGSGAHHGPETTRNMGSRSATSWEWSSSRSWDNKKQVSMGDIHKIHLCMLCACCYITDWLQPWDQPYLKINIILRSPLSWDYYYRDQLNQTNTILRAPLSWDQLYQTNTILRAPLSRDQLYQTNTILRAPLSWDQLYQTNTILRAPLSRDQLYQTNTILRAPLSWDQLYLETNFILRWSLKGVYMGNVKYWHHNIHKILQLRPSWCIDCWKIETFPVRQNWWYTRPY